MVKEYTVLIRFSHLVSRVKREVCYGDDCRCAHHYDLTGIIGGKQHLCDWFRFPLSIKHYSLADSRNGRKGCVIKHYSDNKYDCRFCHALPRDCVGNMAEMVKEIEREFNLEETQ